MAATLLVQSGLIATAEDEPGDKIRRPPRGLTQRHAEAGENLWCSFVESFPISPVKRQMLGALPTNLEEFRPNRPDNATMPPTMAQFVSQSPRPQRYWQ